MEENKCPCPECDKREQEQKESNELNMAVLIALMPILTLTLFGNIGLV